MNAITREDINRIASFLHPLDCGAHYCRYCTAGTHNGWKHLEHCSYAASQADYELAKQTLNRLAELAGVGA